MLLIFPFLNIIQYEYFEGDSRVLPFSDYKTISRNFGKCDVCVCVMFIFRWCAVAWVLYIHMTNGAKLHTKFVFIRTGRSLSIKQIKCIRNSEQLEINFYRSFRSREQYIVFRRRYCLHLHDE